MDEDKKSHDPPWKKLKKGVCFYQKWTLLQGNFTGKITKKKHNLQVTIILFNAQEYSDSKTKGYTIEKVLLQNHTRS